ncbi:FAD:protein FMN transferase [Streptomyces millisiae]|uniref:FAD:protein FMN transferase n=1 Tax=Streptomyces millisiae TaxID=3075542 RepID=A0ABU2LQP3_9ACTN|nr:FAD:protein FMN transferase [Streptomyces sp. DSM 44918]MDT0319916.1 FAD:protein FMN transferase [Streptomyces sp. DSM 44918]
MRERVMGTELLTVLPPGETAAVLGWLRQVEAVFSRFRTDSDVSRANAGGRVAVSDLFLLVLAEACAHQERTGGLFSPFLGAELARLGYAVDFDSVGVADPAPRPAATDSTARPRVHLDHEHGTVRLPAGVAVDLGGFVKGWSVQAAADALRCGRGLIDAGGDLVAWRGPADPPWRVGVEHPLRREPVGVLELPRSAAVATSSVVRRSWPSATGGRLHHVIDPRTGEPADSDCLQATVLARNLATAEVHATCLVILGTAEGPGWLAERDPTAGWLTVDREGAVRHSPELPLERAA